MNLNYPAYTLLADSDSTLGFKAESDLFGCKTLAELETTFGKITDNFVHYLDHCTDQMAQARELYLFDCLMVGVFWNVYGCYAAGSSIPAVRAMQVAAIMRRKGNYQRLAADSFRSLAAYRMLENDGSKNSFLVPGTESLLQLIKWMEATDEFQREAERFRMWHGYLLLLPDKSVFIQISLFRNFALKFAAESEIAFAKYTAGVDEFTRIVKSSFVPREDKISVCRSKTEYHLNIFAVYVYNKALRHPFLNTQSRVVLLPRCMSLKQDFCPALKAQDLHCTHCSTSCQVHKLSEIGTEHGFEVMILSHTSGMSLANSGIDESKGVVGVACAATILSGGLELINKNFAAQCVLLNSCGCRHWLKKASVTRAETSEILYRTLGQIPQLKKNVN